MLLAMQKLSDTWNGIRRDYVNDNEEDYSVETCYTLHADMDSSAAGAYLNVSGISIYASEGSILPAMLPFTVTVQIDDGEIYTYTSTDTVLHGAYSPSGSWMQYYVYITSSTEMPVPVGGESFQITVTVTPNEGTGVSFTESCCGPSSNTVLPPSEMVTGRAYQFIAANPFVADATHRTSVVLTWRPFVDGSYLAKVSDYGYYDPYTRTEDAPSDFSSFYFAIVNPDSIPRASGEYSASEATVRVKTLYLSEDFTNGILITDLTFTVPITPRTEIDSSLKPVLTESMINIIPDPIESSINNKYVHRQTTLYCTPEAGFQFGDSTFYITTGDGANRFTPSISFTVIGVTPGTEYVRPDTGNTEIAGEESISSVTMSVTGDKWRITSDPVTITYPVLYYHVPRLDSFSIHRCTTSGVATDYQYNGTYYKKDDFGAYCLIEYTPVFCSLDSENECSMIIQYGTHTMAITPTSGASSYVVVAANTEQTLDVIIFMYDLFTPYGVSAQLRLSTANVLIDFLANGKGMAVGKNATTQNALDIANGWSLLFYQATVGAYNGSSSTSLIPWMHNVDSRLTALENSQYAN